MHGPAEDDPLVWYEGNTTSDRRWLSTDERGSIVATSNSVGTVTAINAYDEYGIPASTNSGRFGYTGQTWLPEVGLWYYKARIYSPTLGRFLQTDPIGYKDGINWYDYVDGDPVNRSDPSGLSQVNNFDMNLSEDDRTLFGKSEGLGKPPGAFIISGHGGINGEMYNDGRQFGGGKLTTPFHIAKSLNAGEFGYKAGTPIVLAICFAGRGHHAKNLALKMSTTVTATTGFVHYGKGYGQNQRYRPVEAFSREGRAGRNVGFQEVDGKGNVVANWSKITYDTKSGKLTFTGDAKTGSRIISQKTICVNGKGC